MDLTDFVNRMGYGVRSRLRVSAPAWKRTARRWEPLLARLAPAAAARVQQLRDEYDLEAWPRLSTPRELHENLFWLDVLTSALPRARSCGPALDVGSKNGSYLPALHAHAPVPWDLVELDAHRRYADLSTRRAHGESMCRAFAGCRYHATSVTQLEGTYALITWFLPFVRLPPLVAWGLPTRFFAPQALLAHVASRLQAPGTLFIVNQGEKEAEEQHALLSRLGLPFRSVSEVPRTLSPFVAPRFGFVVEKPAAR
ncbi:MAG: hypothetical protein KA712_02400 [Myxococcales bacterium]|nr:hypothetical protein [Myxococcales bacterium]